MLLGIVSLSSAQESVEAASVRGHFANGSDIWLADDFGWFYYDLDEDLGGEMLEIDLEDRTAEKGHIVYSSSVWTEQFEYEPWGGYQAVALFGEPYFAGYPQNSFTEDVSSLESGELRAVLMDDDAVQTLSSNSTLTLQQGYVLVPLEVSEKKSTVSFFLLKNGKPVYASVVSPGETFVYKVGDLPVILVHLAEAMLGEDSGQVEVDGVFQISDEPYISLYDGLLDGEMKLTSHSKVGIEFQNNRSITLRRDSSSFLASALQLVVLDAPEPIYYPVGWIYDYGVHEIRGPAFSDGSSISVRMGDYNSSVIARWNAQNYSGFYFDPDDALGAETLVFYSVEGRRLVPPRETIVNQANMTVFQTGLQYTTFLQPKEFEYKPWGYYYIISLFGNTWFAGYDSSLEGHSSSKSLFENEYLGYILGDNELQGHIMAGNYSLDEGYEMRITDVANDSLFIQLLNDGQLVDSSVVESNTTYVYKKDLENVDDMPIIMIHFGNIFNNGTQRFAAIDGIFQISDRNVFPIESGSGFGELEIVGVRPDVMFLVNHDNINLNRNSNVNIGPGMDVRVADNDTLRYFLHTSSYVVPPPLSPLIEMERNVSSGAETNFSMIVQAGEIRSVVLDIQDSSNKTVLLSDITELGQGSGNIWVYALRWNATTMQLSDDKSQMIDAGGSPVPGILYLNNSSLPLPVRATFDVRGRIGAIADSSSIYYISPEEYEKLNSSFDYDAMLANNTTRSQFLRIEPGESLLQFFDLINGEWTPSGINHTLRGDFRSLEPHAVIIGARPGPYEFSVRIENAAGAKQFYNPINIFPAEVRGVSLGSALAPAGGQASISIEAPKSEAEKRIDISYDPSVLKPLGISGECDASWQVESRMGRIGILMPGGCGEANLTFEVSRKSHVNDTIGIDVINASGFTPETISNGTIKVTPEDETTRKSPASSILAWLLALAAGACARRRH